MSEEAKQETIAAAGAVLAQNVHVCSFSTPWPLKLKLAQNWREWRQIWESYEKVTDLNTASETIRIATFVTCVGQGNLRLHNALNFASEDKKKMDVVVALIHICIQTAMHNM